MSTLIKLQPQQSIVNTPSSEDLVILSVDKLPDGTLVLCLKQHNGEITEFKFASQTTQ